MKKFLTVQYEVQRLTTTTSSGRTVEDWQAIAYVNGSVPQPASLELVSMGQGHFYNTHTIYADDSEDIVVTDRLVDGDDTYTVQGVQNRPYGSGRINHKKIGVIKK